MVWFPLAFENQTRMPGQMDAILFSDALVLYFNGWSSIEDITRRPAIWIPNHLKSKLQKVWYSNVSSIQMVSIQIFTVFYFLDAFRILDLILNIFDRMIGLIISKLDLLILKIYFSVNGFTF